MVSSDKLKNNLKYPDYGNSSKRKSGDSHVCDIEGFSLLAENMAQMAFRELKEPMQTSLLLFVIMVRG